jgi:hypothetical protein
MLTGLLLFLVPALFYFALLYRISAFRRDEQKPSGYFGSPFESMTEVLTRSNYTEAGQRLLPWLVGSVVLLGLGALGALWVITRSS